MGLDMYIFRTDNNRKAATKLVDDIFEAVAKNEREAVPLGDLHVIAHIGDWHNRVEELNPVAYWRKANHIHEWISRHVLGNRPGNDQYRLGFISKEQLLKLSQNCKAVLEHCITQSGEIVIDEDCCRRLFPPNNTILYSGSKEYDAAFIESLRRTQAQINVLLLTTNFNQSVLLYFAYY